MGQAHPLPSFPPCIEYRVNSGGNPASWTRRGGSSVFGQSRLWLWILDSPIRSGNDKNLGIHKFAFGLRDRSSELLSSFYPFLDDNFGIFDGVLVCFTISHTPGKLWHLCNISLVFFTPVDDDLVLTVHLFPPASSGIGE